MAWGDGDAGVYALRVAEEVQQRLHDTFVDTTWPGCPLHRHHPLWLEGEGDWPVWRCVAANVSIAPLGGLPATTRS